MRSKYSFGPNSLEIDTKDGFVYITVPIPKNRLLTVKEEHRLLTVCADFVHRIEAEVEDNDD